MYKYVTKKCIEKHKLRPLRLIRLKILNSRENISSHNYLGSWSATRFAPKDGLSNRI